MFAKNAVTLGNRKRTKNLNVAQDAKGTIMTNRRRNKMSKVNPRRQKERDFFIDQFIRNTIEPLKLIKNNIEINYEMEDAEPLKDTEGFIFNYPPSKMRKITINILEK